jgi:ribonucleotide reductase alpha subunit
VQPVRHFAHKISKHDTGYFIFSNLNKYTKKHSTAPNIQVMANLETVRGMLLNCYTSQVCILIEEITESIVLSVSEERKK